MPEFDSQPTRCLSPLFTKTPEMTGGREKIAAPEPQSSQSVAVISWVYRVDKPMVVTACGERGAAICSTG
jgi:hypothetical protein